MCRGSVRGPKEWSRAARAVGSEVVLWLVLEEDPTRQLRVPRKQLELGPQTLLQKFVVFLVFFVGSTATNFLLVSQLELRLDPEASSRKFRSAWGYRLCADPLTSKSGLEVLMALFGCGRIQDSTEDFRSPPRSFQNRMAMQSRASLGTQVVPPWSAVPGRDIPLMTMAMTTSCAKRTTVSRFGVFEC